MLLRICKQDISLFCAAGEFSDQWEEAMDYLVIIESEHYPNKFIATTSHRNEPFEDVVNMARNWNVKNGPASLQIVEL